MATYIKQITKPLILGLVLITGLAACDTTNTNNELGDQELAQLSSFLTNELALTSAQQDDVNTSFARYGERGDRTPGYMWTVAADLQATLTDEQKESLFNGTDDLERGLSFRGLFGFPGSGGFYGLGGFMGGSRRHGISPMDSVLNLTEEQQAAFQEIHTRYREQFKALADELKAGTLTEDELLTQLLALRDAKQAEVLELFTDEQEAALEAYRTEKEAAFQAFRDEVNAVRNEVLALSAEQAEAIDALFNEQLETRENLIEQLQVGTLTVADFQAEIAALETARLEVLAGLLDATQYEIVQIHDALSVRSGKFGHKGRRGGFGKGQGREQGHTF